MAANDYETSKVQRLIALTGGIGSGKTQVSDYIETKGIPVADADRIVHQLLKQDTTLKNLIIESFGPTVLSEKQEIDRKQLAHIIFGSKEKRKALESWIHPRVREAFLEFRKAHPEAQILIEVIPLLFESKLENMYPEVWLVSAPEDHVLERLQNHRHFTLEEAQSRIKNQLSLPEKQSRLLQHPNGHCLENNGSLAQLYQQVDNRLQNF
jgi:dephospho-CoA kinase